MNIRNFVVPILLGVLCVILFFSHTLYVLKTHQYPAAGLDEHAYLSMAVSFYDSLKNPTLHTLSDIVSYNRYRQPLYGVLLALPLLLFGTTHTYKIALWMNIFFYLATVVGTYLLGRQFLSKKASLLASYMFAFYGFPLFYLHFTYSETATTSFVVFALLYLAKSQNFSITKDIIIFSVIFALGNLVRWVMPIFVGGPLLYTIAIASVRQFRIKTRNIRSYFLNIGLFILIGVLPVLLLLYIPNFSYFSKYITVQKENEIAWAIKWLGGAQFGNVFSIQSLTYYFYILAQQTAFFIAIFLIGFLLALLRMKKYAFLLFSFTFAYIILTLGTTWKGDRFIVPIYPVMALISAIVFDYVKNKKISFALISLTIVLGFLNFLGASWGIGPMKFSTTGGNFVLPNSIMVPMPIGHARRIWLAPISWPPRQDEGNVSQIIQALRSDWGESQRPFRLLFTYEMSQVNDPLYTIFTYQQRGIMIWSNFIEIPKDRFDIFFERIRNTDYIAVKNGIFDKGISEGTDQGWDTLIIFIRRFQKAMQLEGIILPPAFVPISAIRIPFDGSTVTIYKKNREIMPDEWDSFGARFIQVEPESHELVTTALDKVKK